MSIKYAVRLRIATFEHVDNEQQTAINYKAVSRLITGGVVVNGINFTVQLLKFCGVLYYEFNILSHRQRLEVEFDAEYLGDPDDYADDSFMEQNGNDKSMLWRYMLPRFE